MDRPHGRLLPLIYPFYSRIVAKVGERRQKKERDLGPKNRMFVKGHEGTQMLASQHQLLQRQINHAATAPRSRPSIVEPIASSSSCAARPGRGLVPRCRPHSRCCLEETP